MYILYTHRMYDEKKINEYVVDSYEESYQRVMYQAYCNPPTMIIDFCAEMYHFQLIKRICIDLVNVRQFQ